MADYPLPPWLAQTPDYAGIYQRGVSQGAAIGQAQANLAQRQVEAEMEAQARRETLQANIMRAQQEQAIEQAYKQSVLGIRKQELDQAAKKNAADLAMAKERLAEMAYFHDQQAQNQAEANAVRRESAQSKADLYAAQQQFAEGVKQKVASGMTMQEAVQQTLPEVPSLITPTTIAQMAERGKKELTEKQKIDINRQAHAMMNFRTGEDESSPSYQSRTNAATFLLKNYPLTPPPSQMMNAATNTASMKRWRRNPSTGKLEEVR